MSNGPGAYKPQTHRVRRGKVVEIPAEWQGRTVHGQTIRKRAEDRRARGTNTSQQSANNPYAGHVDKRKQPLEVSEDVSEDGRECSRLEQRLLTKAERDYLDEEARSGAVRWHLNPPQREEYSTPLQYITALKKYAERALAEVRGEAR